MTYFLTELIFFTYPAVFWIVGLEFATVKCFPLCTSSFKGFRASTFSEEIIVSKMSAATMVTGQLTVPCDSLSNLCSHVQLCFSPCMVMSNMVVLLQYTVIAMQQNILSFLLSKVFYFYSGGELLNQCQITQLYIVLKVLDNSRQHFTLWCSNVRFTWT